jgi:AraC-like DNA-binding protein
MGQLVKYKSGVIFAVVLTGCVALSLWLSRLIPEHYFDTVISPILVMCSTTVALVGTWIIFRHSEGLRVRKAWGLTLLAWGMADAAYILFWMVAPMPVMNMGAYQLTTHELLIANLLGWLLLLYPTEALRPGWMNVKHALQQLIPMFVLVALDYVLPVNLAPVISLYPFVLTVLLLGHVRVYRSWCEENFSTLDDIDVEWIMRYLVMLVLVGVVYLYMCLTHDPSRGFTQLWLVAFMFVYSTEQILFRRDPWEMVRKTDIEKPVEVPEPNAAYRQALEEWMEREKPFLQPDFKLIDLRQVLPLNRTYLSQFIHSEYDCTFYQLVNRYRVEEAKRLKRENPDLKAKDLSARCGFSSPTVFTRTFTSITGLTPREWSKKEVFSEK